MSLEPFRKRKLHVIYSREAYRKKLEGAHHMGGKDELYLLVVDTQTMSITYHLEVFRGEMSKKLLELYVKEYESLRGMVVMHAFLGNQCQMIKYGIQPEKMLKDKVA